MPDNARSMSRRTNRLEFSLLQHMNETFEKLSDYITDASPGDPLPTAIVQIVDASFAAVARFARTSSRGARPSRTTQQIRILIDAFPEWRRSLTDVEQKVVDVKFGTSGAGPAIERTNAETGGKLDISKQMVAYHLKTILLKLESNFCEPTKNAVTVDHSTVTGRKNTPLREDPEWKRTLRWWRIRSANISETLTAQDLQFLKIVETRLSEIGSEKKAKARTEKTRPGRRRSPARYFALRELFTGKPDLLERLTARQRDAMRIGLALDESEVDEQAELGFRRFTGTESMSKENFNYLLREVVKRLDAADRETVQ